MNYFILYFNYNSLALIVVRGLVQYEWNATHFLLWKCKMSPFIWDSNCLVSLRGKSYT
ncbi:hypothetical protein ND2E_2071 [Colwellia psychrerythraea]|uniref:Uncharacterized protein n=1 Tax=Colwellia psychrerythraea TaxID=28229 RepID=A0A099KWY4_COLPS|nr:hypothetical protein ND2E_2071 [Colwellia psychrerythraea]